MIIYIAGKITGLDKETYSTNFNYVDKRLKELGFDTLNPVEIVNPNVSYDEALDHCFSLIRESDAIYLMSNWTDSEGAKREYEYARGLGKIILIGGEV